MDKINCFGNDFTFTQIEKEFSKNVNWKFSIYSILFGIDNDLLCLFVFNSKEVEKLIEKYEFLPKLIDKGFNKINELYVYYNEITL